MKLPPAPHLIWASATAITGLVCFAAGNSRNHAAADNAEATLPKVTTTHAANPRENPPSASRAVATRDNGVLDFLARHKLDGSGPVSAERMKEAVAEAMHETNPVRSQMLFARLMEELTPENAPAVLAALREGPGGFESFRYMGMLAYQWGTVDPKSAMKAMQGMGGGRGGRFVEGSILTGWAMTDATGAIDFLKNYKGENKEDISRSLVSGLARADVNGAVRYAASLQDRGEKARASESIAREVLRTQGSAAATSWMLALGDDSMKRGAFDTLSEDMMRKDFEKGAAFVKQYQDQDFARGAVGELADQLTERDVKKGIEFAESLGGKSQGRAYYEVIDKWMEKDHGKDAMAASEYASKLPAGPAKDAASHVIARRIAEEDPQAAIAWVGAIQDEDTRTEAYYEVGRRYLHNDPKTAASWLPQSGLPANIQQQLAKELQPRENRDGPPRDFRGRSRRG